MLLLEHVDRNVIEPVYLAPSSGPISEKIGKIGITTYIVNYGRWISRPLPFLKFLFFLPSSLAAVHRIIKKEDIDIVYTNTMVIVQGALLAKWMRIPHIWHVRELPANDPGLIPIVGLRNTYNLIRRFSTKIIAISKSVAQPLLHKAENKVTVIYNATDLHSQFPAAPAHCRFNEELPTKNDCLLIGVVGELHPRKGQDDAIRAFALVKQEMENVQLVLVGREEKKYRQYLEKIIADLNLHGSVIFTGFQKNVKPLISQFRVTLMPSWSEPFGRVTIESMALGVPVVGTNSGGTSEIIEDGVSGFLVPPQSPEHMAEKTLLLLRNKKLCSQMAEKCRHIAQKNFSPQRYAQNISAVIVETFQENSSTE
ncbi:MAG: glycosyltransferase family 4 protein [Desulfobulbaceae bacterium]|nr:glycosyltransferase family 4 protein [Desulfobulbaceae bacterium]